MLGTGCFFPSVFVLFLFFFSQKQFVNQKKFAGLKQQGLFAMASERTQLYITFPKCLLEKVSL